MTNYYPTLEPNTFYHIFNRGNTGLVVKMK